MGLIDEYNIIVHPFILGRGKLLLKDLDIRQQLKLTGVKQYISGAIGLSYERAPMETPKQRGTEPAIQQP